MSFCKIVRGEVRRELPVSQAIDWLEDAMERHQGDWSAVRKEFESAIERMKTTK